MNRPLSFRLPHNSHIVSLILASKLIGLFASTTLVIIDDLNLIGIAAPEFEAKSILVINANTV